MIRTPAERVSLLVSEGPPETLRFRLRLGRRHAAVVRRPEHESSTRPAAARCGSGGIGVGVTRLVVREGGSCGSQRHY